MSKAPGMSEYHKERRTALPLWALEKHWRVLSWITMWGRFENAHFSAMGSCWNWNSNILTIASWSEVKFFVLGRSQTMLLSLRVISTRSGCRWVTSSAEMDDWRDRFKHTWWLNALSTSSCLVECFCKHLSHRRGFSSLLCFVTGFDISCYQRLK